jgi:hypothetical protein
MPIPSSIVRFTSGRFLDISRVAEQRGMDGRGIELAAGVGAFLSRPELSGLLLAGGSLPDWPWE